MIIRDCAALSLLGALGLSYGCGSGQSAAGGGAGATASSAGATANGGAEAVAGANTTGGSAGNMNVSGSAGVNDAGAGPGDTPEPMPGPARCSEETELGSSTPSVGARVVKSGGASPGKTATLVGFSATDVKVGTNAVLWARYSGAQTFRTFGSVPPKTVAGDKVTTEALFNGARDKLAAAPDTSPLVDWAYIRNYILTHKAAGVLPMAAALKAPLVVEIKTVASTIPLTSGTAPGDWGNKWEVWKNYFACAYVFAHDYGTSHFEIYNEPDLGSGQPSALPDYTIRAELAGDAIQLGVKAANAAHPNAPQLEPIVIAPTTASDHVSYGNVVVGIVHDGPLGKPAAAPYTLWQGFGYHNYDGDSVTAFKGVTDVYNTVLAAKLPNTPWYITEFNALTNAKSKTLAESSTTLYPDGDKTYVADLPDFSRRLVEKAIGYSESNVGPMNLYAFNFLSEPEGTLYANNGLHWSDNSVVGGDSLAAAAYRLLIKHFGDARDLLGLVVAALPADATSQKPGNTLFEATYDARYDAYFILASNRANTQEKVFFDLSSLKLPPGLVATVIDADAKHHGEITHRYTLSAQSTFEITQEPDAITLVSVPASAGTVIGLGADADTTLAPGLLSATRLGDKPTLDLAADSSAASKLRTALIAFPLPALSGNGVGEAILDLSLTADSKASSDIIHVYGIADKGLTDDAKTGATWDDVPNLKKLATGAKYATVTDNAINYTVNKDLDPELRIAGTAIASGGPLRVDITDYIREQVALEHTRVSLLLVREVNHHTDTISYAASLNSREAACGAPALLLRTFTLPK